MTSFFGKEERNVGSEERGAYGTERHEAGGGYNAEPDSGGEPVTSYEYGPQKGNETIRFSACDVEGQKQGHSHTNLSSQSSHDYEGQTHEHSVEHANLSSPSSRSEKPYFKGLGEEAADETTLKQRTVRTLYGGTSFIECNFLKTALVPAKRRLLWTAILTAKRSANSRVVELKRILSDGDELSKMKAQRDLDEYQHRVVAFRTAPASIKFQEGYGERPGERIDYKTRMTMALPPFPEEPSLNDEDNNWVHAVFDVGIWTMKKRDEELIRGLFRDPESIYSFINLVKDAKLKEGKSQKKALKELDTLLRGIPGQSERTVRLGSDTPLGAINFSFLDEFLESVKIFEQMHGKIQLLDGATRRIEVRYRHVKMDDGTLAPKFEFKSAWDGPNAWTEFGSSGFDHVIRIRNPDTNVQLGLHFAIG